MLLSEAERWSVADCFLVAAVSVPKKKRKMKDLNKKEAVGDLLDAFKEVRVCAVINLIIIIILLFFRPHRNQIRIQMPALVRTEP